MTDKKYRSIFASHIMAFISMKRVQGFKTARTEYVLKELDDILVDDKINEPILTKAMVTKWRASRVNDSVNTLYGKYSIISQFSKYMSHCGFISYVPPMPKHERRVFVPKIFSEGEIQQIFVSADELEIKCHDTKQALFSIPTLIRFLYATGVRIGEALRLTNQDVDFARGTILIRKSKNQRQRLIPMGGNLKDLLTQYAQKKGLLPMIGGAQANAPFFINEKGESISCLCAYTWFRKILKKAGIPFIGDRKGPRLHDLRHTFAVHTLMRQVKAGKDLYCLLPIISIFMGHKSISGTEYYVRLTSEMFPDINIDIGLISSHVFPSLDMIVRDYEE